MDKIVPKQLEEASNSLEINKSVIEINTLIEEVCRICFEGESPCKKLITPCKCLGSVRYIHEECLKTWILSQEEDITQAHCELCLHPFNMHYKMAMKFDMNKICKEGLAQCIFAPLLLLVLTMMGLIIYLLIIRYSTDISKKEIAYNSVLLLICIIATMVIVLMMAKATRDYCCKKKMTEWTIRSCIPNYLTADEESRLNNFSKNEETLVDARRHTERIEHFQQSFSDDDDGTYQRIDSSALQRRGISFDAPIFRRRNHISFGR